jgi:hypothetical protein
LEIGVFFKVRSCGILADEEVTEIVIGSGELLGFGFLVIFLCVVEMGFDEVLLTAVVDYTFLVDEAEISQGIEMVFLGCFLVVLDASTNFCVSVGIETIEMLLEVQPALLKILADLVESLRVTFLSRSHEILEGLVHILLKAFPLFMQYSQYVEDSGIRGGLSGNFLVNLDGFGCLLGSCEAEEHFVCQLKIALDYFGFGWGQRFLVLFEGFDDIVPYLGELSPESLWELL